MNRKGYDALDVANYIVNYSIDQKSPVSNLKLQKLLYYVQAASLAQNGEPMFCDDISAWKYGPVVESVYHSFKWYVDKVIDDKVTQKDLFFDFDSESYYDPDTIIDDKDKELIKHVVDTFKAYSALSMVKKTHREKPWKDAYDKNEDYIDNEEIKCFYSGENKGLIYGK